MDTISSKNNDLIKATARLLQKKYREDSGMFLVEGKRAVEDILRHCPSLIEKIFVTADSGMSGDVLLPSEVMKKLSETANPQGAVAVVRKPKPKPAGGFALFLDRVRDPGNVGTLIRTAVAVGFNDIYLYDSADAYCGKVVRSTMSAIVKANVFESANYNTLRELISDGYITVCADMNGENAFEYKVQADKICLVIGNEANGVSEEVKQLCSVSLSLPMSGNIESLNAAVSGSILMYNLKFLK